MTEMPETTKGLIEQLAIALGPVGQIVASALGGGVLVKIIDAFVARRRSSAEADKIDADAEAVRAKITAEAYAEARLLWESTIGSLKTQVAELRERLDASEAECARRLREAQEEHQRQMKYVLNELVKRLPPADHSHGYPPLEVDVEAWASIAPAAKE